MQFVQRDNEWLLVDESDACRVIATLRNEVEAVTLAEFCKLNAVLQPHPTSDLGRVHVGELVLAHRPSPLIDLDGN